MNLRIVLNYERKLYILEMDPPKTPNVNSRASELTSFKKYEDDAGDVKCIIMASMTAKLQRLHADMEVRPMIQCLRDLYQGKQKEKFAPGGRWGEIVGMDVTTRFREEERAEFVELKQRDMTLPEYRQRFVHHAQFAPTLVSITADCIEEFRKRLRPDLRPHVSTIQTVDLIEAYDLISKADKDLSDYYESLKTEVANSNVQPTTSGKRPLQEIDSALHSKKEKTNDNSINVIHEQNEGAVHTVAWYRAYGRGYREWRYLGTV
ncbi:unnamed protein product [Cuscuta campestris]|uniref:Retrotransposon gag domain-containing protein n=1 Tax=Cuscuta campestris TaxID=132261 RepID=A0A484MBU2_9ASTE|nr:unnamed protein product [Cuscuta campestris]